MNDTLEFDGLEISFGERRVLSGVYMKCSIGEVVGILGRNGSGKSTLMKIVFGSLRAEYQSVRINGIALGTDRIKRRLMGYLPQNDLVPPSMRVRQAFDLFKVPHGAMMNVLPEVASFLDHRMYQLSGGFQRIIEAALILKTKNKFCILDEPFSGIAPLHIEKIQQLMREEKANKGIIITDHLYRHVLDMSDRIYLLDNGHSHVAKDEHDLLARGYIAHL